MIGTKEERKAVRERQDPLMQNYAVNPEDAQIIDRAKTKGGTATDAFHGNVVLGNEEFGVILPFGIHKAVGGYSDAPNPGDLLCGALAACLDSTIRIIAERFGVKLESLEVSVEANLDVRGTLLVNREVPVGFQTINCDVNLKAAKGTNPRILQKLLSAAENSCVTMQTLLSSVSIETNLSQN